MAINGVKINVINHLIRDKKILIRYDKMDFPQVTLMIRQQIRGVIVLRSDMYNVNNRWDFDIRKQKEKFLSYFALFTNL